MDTTLQFWDTWLGKYCALRSSHRCSVLIVLCSTSQPSNDGHLPETPKKSFGISLKPLQHQSLCFQYLVSRPLSVQYYSYSFTKPLSHLHHILTTFPLHFELPPSDSLVTLSSQSSNQTVKATSSTQALNRVCRPRSTVSGFWATLRVFQRLFCSV